MSSPEMDALLTLQAVDTRIDQERHRRETLPERARLIELERTRRQREQERAATQKVLDEIGGRQAAAEHDLESSERRIKEVNARLYGGTVSASRELQAMAEDVKALQARVADLEDKILAVLDEREPLDAQVRAIDEALGAIEAERTTLTQALAAAEVESDARSTALQAEREAAAAAAPAGQLPTYDSLRRRLGGVAVARLIGGRCDGCHLTLPAVELDHIRHLPPGEIAYCEQCGRILVP
jgi:predicted  nucleic acid-binding Zn-ribbon protein